MVMQNPQLESWEILECGEAPLDLSASSTRPKDPTASDPDYPEDDSYQEQRIDDGYRVEDYIRYHVMEPMIQETTAISDDSNDSSDVLEGMCMDDSENPRGLPQKHAKSYKKAIMRRYLDTDRSRKGSRHSPMKPTTTASTSTKVVSSTSPSKGTSTSSRRRSWDQISSCPSDNSPTHNTMYTNETYMTHPASHIGHRTAYSLSHPKTSVDTDNIRVMPYHSYMIPNTSAVTTTAVPGTSSNRGSSTTSCWSSWRQTNPRSSNSSPIQNTIYNTNETYKTHPVDHVGHLPRSNSPTHKSLYINNDHVGHLPRSNSPTHKSLYINNETYTTHPAAHMGHLPRSNSPTHNSIYTTNGTYTTHPAAHVGHLPSNNSPTHIPIYNTNVTYTILHPVDHRGHLAAYSAAQAKNLEFKRKYSNGTDNNWEPPCEEYDNLRLYYPTTDSNSTNDGYTLEHSNSPALGCAGNYEDLRAVSPQDLTIDIPEDGLQKINNLRIQEKRNAPDIQPNRKPEIEINLSDACIEAVLRKVPGVASRARWPKSWEYIMRLLVHEETNPALVRWEDKSQHIFRLVQSDKVTHIWNTKSDQTTHSYYNFARGLRYHYKAKILIPIKQKQLVYQCGPKAIEYINELLRDAL